MSDNTYLKYIFVILGVVSIVYLLQIYSPLRLNVDAVNYLSMAASAADGNGFGKRYFPIGYPVLLAGLDRAGLGTSWAFIGLNGLFLAVGLVASYLMLHRTLRHTRWVSLLLCCLTLLCFVVVKHVSLPMAEIPFFGVSMAGLYALSWAERRPDSRRWYAIGIAALFTVASISIRTIGVAMIPALLWVCLSEQSFRRLPFATTRHRWLLLSVLLALAVVVLVLMSQAFGLPKYLNELINQYRSSSLSGRVSYNLNAKLSEWGELLVNIPRSKSPELLKVAFPFLGLVGLGTLFYGIWTRRRDVGALEVFVLAYTAILFVWPGFSARFWLPVVPLLMGWIALVLQKLTRTALRRRVLILYLLWFAFTGCAALVYSSRITFAGSAFPDRYGDGTFRPTYRAAFNGWTEEGRDALEGWAGAGAVRRRALGLLIRYEPRVHPRFKDEATP